MQKQGKKEGTMQIPKIRLGVELLFFVCFYILSSLSKAIEK